MIDGLATVAGAIVMFIAGWVARDAYLERPREVAGWEIPGRAWMTTADETHVWSVGAYFDPDRCHVTFARVPYDYVADPRDHGL